MAGKFAAWSSYNYVVGNPVSLIDPNGAEAVYVDGVRQDGYEADLWKREATSSGGGGNPIIEGLRKSFKKANQALIEYGVEQDVIDAGNGECSITCV